MSGIKNYLMFMQDNLYLIEGNFDIKYFLQQSRNYTSSNIAPGYYQSIEVTSVY